MMVADDELGWPAVHEAGHCVLARHFAHKVNFVWIDWRDGKTNVDIYRESYGNERQYRLEQIIVFQSGRAALDHLSGYKHEYPDWQESDDYKLSWPRAMWLSGDDEHAAGLLLQWGARRSECLVVEYWSQIEKLACAMQEQFLLTGNRRVDADQITELLSRA